MARNSRALEPQGVEDGAPSNLGARLREARGQRGVSLRSLAKRVGVSPSLVSQVERGTVTPSVGTLYAIVRELDLSMDDLFSEAQRRELDVGDAVGHGPVQPRDSRATIYLASGVRWERLTAERDPILDFQVSTYAVGAESCPRDALMTHGGREYGYVISGRLELTVGNETYELGPGDAASFSSTTPHRLANLGDEPTETLWVVVGRERDTRPAS
jgi:transcriptional regulator with XRE-family HTH domain